MQEKAPTDDELRLIHALQVWPRAPWSLLGPIFDVDPVTLARRWSALTSRGMAWVTSQPPSSSVARTSPALGAIVEVECVAGSIDSVITELSQDRECLSIDVASGGRDVILTVGGRTPAEFNRYVISRVPGIPDVRTVRTHPVITTVSAAPQWRLRALDADEVSVIDAARHTETARLSAMFSRPPVADPDIIAILSHDGRATTRMVSEALGVPMRRARVQLSATLASGSFEIRTDMPRWASGYPICAWYFLRVPAAQIAQVGRRLSGLPAVRTVLSVAGPANLLVSVWLRELSDVEGLEVVIEQKLPAVSILDRSVVLSVRKRMGRVFDEDEIPMQVVPWDGLP